MATNPRGRKSKSPDKRPAKNRYWTKRTLEKHKVRHIMKSCGLSYEESLWFWRSRRQGRIPETYFKKGA